MRTLNFYISNPANGNSRTAHPIYADGFGFVSERESGQIFTRTKLSDRLTFTAEDFVFIMSQAFDSVIAVDIDVINAGVIEMQWHGNFARTDCTINEVDKVLSVTPEVVDDYTDILDVLDREFNLSELPIKQRTPWAEVKVPPVLQIYFVGKNKITNYWQGECWQTDVDPITDTDELESMGFTTSPSFYTGFQHAYVRMICSTGGYAEIHDDYNINPIFKYSRPLPLDAYHITLTYSYLDTPNVTKWGEKYFNGVSTGKYYVQPVEAGYVYVPFRGKEWDTQSWWLRVDENYTTEIDDDTQFEYIKSAYSLDALLGGLLSANNLNVNFERDAKHSIFIYGGAAPITGWSGGWDLLFTAKSNILNLIDKSTDPATKFPCTLATVLNFLKNAMNIWWSVENGNLRLEHLSYYKNGGTYGGTPSVQYDLTKMMNPRNGKPWAWGQNQYQFEKYEMPQFIKYMYMDETDTIFDGSGLECLSNYVAKGRTEDVTVANVSTNIVKMFLQPENFSMEGMAVIFITANNHTDYTPFPRDIGGTWRVINGELAMWTLQQSLLLYDAPCDKIKVSGSVFSDVDYKRTKYNEVVFPAATVDPDKHIITNVGDGEPETITNDITSDSIKVKLKYLN